MCPQVRGSDAKVGEIPRCPGVGLTRKMLSMNAELHHIAAQARFADLSRATTSKAGSRVERQGRTPRTLRRRSQWLRGRGVLRPAL